MSFWCTVLCISRTLSHSLCCMEISLCIIYESNVILSKKFERIQYAKYIKSFWLILEWNKKEERDSACASAKILGISAIISCDSNLMSMMTCISTATVYRAASLSIVFVAFSLPQNALIQLFGVFIPMSWIHSWMFVLYDNTLLFHRMAFIGSFCRKNVFLQNWSATKLSAFPWYFDNSKEILDILIIISNM